MILDVGAYFGLFSSAFLSATLIPSVSEGVLVGLLTTYKYDFILLLAFASIGNIMGSILNWFLGSRIEQYSDRKWFPVKEEKLTKAQGWYKKYGKWSLLCSWVPVIGDPLTLVAGVMKESLLVFIILVSIAKTTRYVVVGTSFLYLV